MTHSSSRRGLLRNVVAPAAVVGMLLAAGCTAGTGSPTPSGTGTAAPAAPSPQGAAPTEPSIEITYEVDGRSETITSQPDKALCAAGVLQAFSDGEVAAMVSLPDEEGRQGQIRAYVLDGLYVGFLGRSVAEQEQLDDGALRASVVALDGTATLVELPEGERPSAGELDLTSGVEVPATLTATVVCPAE